MINNPLRLTLRTVLAYLDDTLEPMQASDIGQRITENENAQELISRIRKVIRKRRLGAPGLDAKDFDLNDVSEYLEGMASPDKVNDLERRCLDTQHDEFLAEVASAHQILSMVLGTPVEIRPEVRSRAYQIGGAAFRKSGRRRQTIEPSPLVTGQMLDPPSQIESQNIPLSLPNQGSPKGMFLNLILATGLLAGLVFVIFHTISVPTPSEGKLQASLRDKKPAIPVEPPSAPVEPSAAAKPPQPDAPPQPMPPPPAEPKQEADAPPKKAVDPPQPDAPAPAAGKEEMKPAPVEKTEPKPPLELAAKDKPADILNVLDATTPVAAYASAAGVLLQQSNNGMRRLKSGQFVYAQDQLLSFDADRATLELSTRAQIELVGQTQLRLGLPRPPVFPIELLEGRLVIRTAESPTALQLGNDPFEMSCRFIGNNVLLAIERLDNQSTRFQVVRGEMEASVATQKVLVPAGHELLWERDGRLSTAAPTNKALSWIEAGSEAPAGKELANALPFGDKIVESLRGELSSKSKDHRRQAILALGLAGGVSDLCKVLTHESADVRQQTLQILHEKIGRDRSAAAVVRDALKESFPQRDSDDILQLLEGFSDDELKRKETYESMIGGLEAETKIVREASIWALRQITGKEFNYSADATTSQRSASVRRWRTWLADLKPGSLPPKKS